ncbi:MAG: LLM class flavin-dependent oxidoreductase [Microthrixaceae bacterium]|nr:LLM class flavin-dependent oxidoreductase [Microthrixaceae bacterium]
MQPDPSTPAAESTYPAANGTDDLTLSVLDLAVVGGGSTVGEALRGSEEMARLAERLGYRRVWYAEHHNMSSIASAATSVLIAHVAARTSTIRLGSGGIMLPNHSPLTVAEQFGTLAELHPGRIDLGLGRAPGTDQVTLAALRRDPAAAEHFPEDVLELQAYLAGDGAVGGIRATPGAGTRVPLYILGSSLFGASLAARLGLPYGFASHFAPQALTEAVQLYRREFRPSGQLGEPYVIAAANIVVEPTAEEAEEELRAVTRSRVATFLGRGRRFSEEELDALVESRAGRQVASMMQYTGAGDPLQVNAYLQRFREHSGADEVMVVPASRRVEGRLRSLELLISAS